MGSLNDGSLITQATNNRSYRHQGNQIIIQPLHGTELAIANSGTVVTTSLGLGVVFTPGGANTYTSGMSLVLRESDTSVERQKFTTDGTASGLLQHIVTRKIAGIHTSISDRAASGALGGMETLTERKVFFLNSDRGKTTGLAAWSIFDVNGDAVGESDGTTDTDTNPAPTWDGS